MAQADRMFVQAKTYHQRGETYYVTRPITITSMKKKKLKAA